MKAEVPAEAQEADVIRICSECNYVSGVLKKQELTQHGETNTNKMR